MTVRADIATIGARAEAMLAELGAISSEPQRLVRLYLSPEHRRAADLIASWMREAGMTVTEDALGTVRGHWRPELKKRLLIGSHIDTVIDAGRYDGPLGVVAGILAVRELAARNVDLPFGIDVLAFGDEEGSRFRTTLAGSSACAGVFDRSSLAFPDRNGISLADAIRAYGQERRRHSGGGLRPRATSSAMSRCISSRGRCWKRRTCRSASSPASSVRAACASSFLARPVMPAPCRCTCATMRSSARPN